jgi:hypothetical protein
MDQGSRGKGVPPPRHQLYKKQWNRGVRGRRYRLPDISCTRNNGLGEYRGEGVSPPRRQLYKKQLMEHGSRGRGYRLADISSTRNNGTGE